MHGKVRRRERERSLGEEEKERTGKREQKWLKKGGISLQRLLLGGDRN